MPRSVRKARNQEVFRHVNEAIAEATSRFDLDAEAQADFICECHRIGCTTFVRLPVHFYVLARDDPSMFVVLPGHEDPEYETVVIDQGSYLIVRVMPDINEALAGTTN
jgi:hypothetical protein